MFYETPASFKDVIWRLFVTKNDQRNAIFGYICQEQHPKWYAKIYCGLVASEQIWSTKSLVKLDFPYTSENMEFTDEMITPKINLFLILNKKVPVFYFEKCFLKPKKGSLTPHVFQLGDSTCLIWHNFCIYFHKYDVYKNHEVLAGTNYYLFRAPPPYWAHFGLRNILI